MTLATDKTVALRSLTYLPNTTIYSMSYSSPQYLPLDFEPDSIYLVFVLQAGSRPCAGVFHHNSESRGILAYADVGVLGPRRSHCNVFSFELKQSKLPISNAACTRLTFTSRDRNRLPSLLRTRWRAFTTTSGYQTRIFVLPSLSTRING